MSLRLSHIQDRWLAGFVFGITFLAYAVTAYPTVTTEDSGEFATAIHTLGIAHPSGYPLYVILGKIFSVLVPFGSPAWKANLFSAFCSAAAAAALFLLLRKILKALANKTSASSDPDRQPNSPGPAIPLAVTLFFASGQLIWSQAVRAEVYGLNSFLFITILLLAFHWRDQYQNNHPKSTKTLLWLIFLYGLSLTNHQLMLMAAPALLLWVLMVYPRVWANIRLLAKAAALLTLGLSLYLFLPLRASYEVPLNWGSPTTLEKTWQHINRSFYSASAVDASLNFVQNEPPATAQTPESANSTTQNQNPSWLQSHIMSFWSQATSLFAQNYTGIAVILAAVGVILLFFQSQKIALFILALILFYSTILSSLLGLGITEKLPVRFFIDRPFYIPLFILLTIPTAAALSFISNKLLTILKKGSPNTQTSKSTPLISTITATMIIFLAVVTLAIQIPPNNQSHNRLAYQIAAQALDSLPQQAVLISENYDNTLFPLLYLQVVEGRRPDVDIYITAPINIFHYFRSLEDTIKQNPGRRLFTDFPFIYYPGKTYHYGGTFSEIVSATAPPPPTSAPSNPASPERTPLSITSDSLPPGLTEIPPNLDHFNRYLLARWYTDQGLALHADQPTEESLTAQRQLFQKAWETAPESRNILGQLIGQYLVINTHYAEAIPYLEEAQRLMPDEYPINFQLAYAYHQTNQPDKAQALINSLPPDQQELIQTELSALVTPATP